MARGHLTPFIVTYAYICFSRRSTAARAFRFDADWNAPLPIHKVSRGFSAWLDTRLLSMPDPSTSELLRTLWMNGCFQANMLAVMGKGLR